MAQPTGAERWHGTRFVVKERRLTIGRQYRVYDEQGAMQAYCKQKLFKLKEDIRFYADEGQTEELFRLSARKVLDFNANLDVVEAGTDRRLGSLRRKGWRSLLRDKWEVYDADEALVATLEEDSWLMAFLRRFVLSIFPMRYTLTDTTGAERARVSERFQLFGDTYDLTLPEGSGLDPRVVIGLTVCVDALEAE